MNTSILITGILINITFLTALFFYYIKPKNKERKMQKLALVYKTQLTELKGEVSRQAIIITDYKERLQFTDKVSDSKITTFKPNADLEKLSEAISDKQMLEKEKEAFKLKNQKLWEQSLAVYSEKERINTMRKYIESRHTNLTHSINYALRIQNALIPSEDLMKQIFPNHFMLFRPRDIVSGDFYWTKQINNKTIIVAADCTGHGVPGAFMSLLGISFLNEIASAKRNLSAAQVLEEMRLKVKDLFRQDDGNISIQDGMDMVVCIVDQDTKELQFSGANNGIFIAKNNETLVEIKGTRNPISYYRKEKDFENHSIQLEVNDTIFMYSDGYFDQFGGTNKKKINRSGFCNVLNQCMEEKLPLSAYKSRLESFLDNWQGDIEQIDDILVFGVTCFTDGGNVELF